MSVRKVKRHYPGTDKMHEFWMVDIDYQSLNGEAVRIRRKSPIQTKAGAAQYERELRIELANGSLKQKEEKKEIPTLKEFSEEFLNSYAKVHNKQSEVESKKGNLCRYLLPALGTKNLDEIRVRDIDNLKGMLLKKNLKAKTVNNALATLSKLLRYAEEIEIIEKAPSIRLLKVDDPEFDFLTFEEADRLIEAAGYNSEWKIMIYIALKTGIRFGELCELRWKDVDLKNGLMVVRRNYYRGNVTTPKGGRKRDIPLSSQTVAVLKQHQHLKGELIFCKPDGGRHIHRRADVAIKRCCGYAGLRMIGWHTLRHTFASHLVMRGATLKAVQELLGHATIDMTMRYAHLFPDVKSETVALLDYSARNLRQHRGNEN